MLSLKETITVEEVQVFIEEADSERERASYNTFKIALKAVGGFAVAEDALGGWVFERLSEKYGLGVLPSWLIDAIDFYELGQNYRSLFHVLEVDGFVFYAPDRSFWWMVKGFA